MSITQPNFERIFAGNANVGEVLQMPNSDYSRGWGYLKDYEPPPMEFFNYLTKFADMKLNYLFIAGRIRESGKRYEVGEVLTSPNLKRKYVLECITAGVTANEEPDFSQDVPTVQDGGCTWKLRNVLDCHTISGYTIEDIRQMIKDSINKTEIQKVVFSNSAALWANVNGMQRLKVARSGYTCTSVYKVERGEESIVFADITMDRDYIYITAPNRFAGYLVLVKYTTIGEK